MWYCNKYGYVAEQAELWDTFEFTRCSENRYLLFFQNKTDREAFINTRPERITGHELRDDFNLMVFF